MTRAQLRAQQAEVVRQRVAEWERIKKAREEAEPRLDWSFIVGACGLVLYLVSVVLFMASRLWSAAH
jgi:hypothetical protein